MVVAMEKCLLIKNGRIVDPARGINQAGDIFVENGKIVKQIHPDRLKDGSIINAGGCLVVPGLIDFHAHLFLAELMPGYRQIQHFCHQE